MKAHSSLATIAGILLLPCLATVGCMQQTTPPAEYEQSSLLSEPQIVTHTVARGETLMSISRKYTGTPKNWKRIASANSINPNKLRAGDTLVIPATLVAASPAPSNRMALLSDSDILPTGRGLPKAASLAETKNRSEAKATVGTTKKSTERTARTNDPKSKDSKSTAPSKLARNTSSSRARDKEQQAREVVIFDPTPEEKLADLPSPPHSEPAKAAPSTKEIIARHMEEKTKEEKLNAVELAAATAAEPTHRRDSRAMLDTPSGIAPRSATESKPTARAKPAAETVSTQTVEKPAVFRKPGQKKEVPQNTRSNFYSCVADKCSYHSF
ncbi:MAG: LysM peptidoglycan-binding domain-containing protein [Bdellovibrionota bacterium]